MMNANALFTTLLTRRMLTQLRKAARSLILDLFTGAANSIHRSSAGSRPEQ